MQKILVIDDEPDIRDMLRMIFEYEGYGYLSAPGGQAGLKIVEDEKPDLIFLDIKMPKMDGLEVLSRLRQAGNTKPVVVISGHGTLATAVEATKLGAFDFVEKPLDRERMLLLARNALQAYTLAEENQKLKLRFEKRYRMIGESRALREAQILVQKSAPTNATVLIVGESGTGKELIARTIHGNSGRPGPFVQVNCAAIPEDLIESELFGHERGSFTGATERQVGKFVQADRGTLFLDEVGDMSLKTQAKVLRTLQEGEVEPIGAQKTIRVDVRVIAATNKNLGEEIGKGNFREDLFFRLNVVPIPCPPLRERREDIPLLIDHFIANFCEENTFKPKKFSERAMEKMKKYSWKGNIRELKNTVERLLILTAGGVIDEMDLPQDIRSDPGVMLPDFRSFQTLKEFKDATERAFLIEKLKENDWNISLTAQKIDTPRSNLYKKLEQYNISEKSDS